MCMPRAPKIPAPTGPGKTTASEVTERQSAPRSASGVGIGNRASQGTKAFRVGTMAAKKGAK